MTSKVLVPYDGSEMSDEALDKAIEFKPFKSETIILYVLDGRLIPSYAAKFIGEKSAFEDAKMAALNILKSGAETMLKYKMEKVKANGMNVRFITGIGAPAEGIINVAENEHVDLVIGSREVKREKENVAGKLKLLGSVARRVSEIAECPVLIIN